MTPRQFWQLCRQHDWYYAYSDDHRVWLRGEEATRAMEQLVKDQPKLRSIYAEFVFWINQEVRGEPPAEPKD